VPYWAVYQALRAIVAGTATRAELFGDAVAAAGGVLGMAALLGASTWMSHRAAFATLENLRLRMAATVSSIAVKRCSRSGRYASCHGDGLGVQSCGASCQPTASTRSCQ
jgi:hypothetical protein